VLNRPLFFLENLPVSGKKQGPMRGISGDLQVDFATSPFMFVSERATPLSSGIQSGPWIVVRP
jgi:hypothetical protein